jgi:hypothetical protein
MSDGLWGMGGRGAIPRHYSPTDPIFWFFYFLPPTYFLKYFFIQNWSLRPWFSLYHKTQNPTNPQPYPKPYTLNRDQIFFIIAYLQARPRNLSDVYIQPIKNVTTIK